MRRKAPEKRRGRNRRCRRRHRNEEAREPMTNERDKIQVYLLVKKDIMFASSMNEICSMLNETCLRND